MPRNRKNQANQFEPSIQQTVSKDHIVPVAPFLPRMQIHPESSLSISTKRSESGKFNQVLQRLQTGFRVGRMLIIKGHNRVRFLGGTAALSEVERRRLSLLNQINFLHFITCLIVPFATLLNDPKISTGLFLLSLTPSMVSVIVLLLNASRRFNAALIVYFTLYPFFTCLIYLGGMNLGMELYFIMYGILAVFFLPEITYMLLSIGFSMVSYFMLSVVLQRYLFQLHFENPFFYFFNQGIAIILIFYGLYLIKKENTRYQQEILLRNTDLQEAKVEVEQKNEIISRKARELELQTEELTALNTVKTKLFSIISHDLKLPMYALRNIFQQMQQQHFTADQIKAILPEVIADLNSTTDHMENILQWAKDQMKAEVLHPEMINIADLVEEVASVLHLQVENKELLLETFIDPRMNAWADRETIHLVIRNLLSNAIKFSSPGKRIQIRAAKSNDRMKISVHDEGAGMSAESIAGIFEGNYYSTKGTADESGTGLGLLLCQEYLTKNSGKLYIESAAGAGSVFSITLPLSSASSAVGID